MNFLGNLISILWNSKKVLFLFFLLFLLITFDEGIKKDIYNKLGINLDKIEVKKQDINLNNKSTVNKSDLESDKIYLMYKDKFKVIKVVDGDTIYVRKVMNDGSLENYTYKIRMMAINTLEKNSLDKREVCLANLAQQFTEQNLINKFIYIYGDTTQPELDQHKRILAYVLIENDKEFFNDRIMKTGLSKTYKASPPATNWQKYENIKTEMEKEKKGIWDEEVCKI